VQEVRVKHGASALTGAIVPQRLEAVARRPRTRVERLVREETGITPDTALRPARYFRTTPERAADRNRARAAGAQGQLKTLVAL
jgi:hypothetical protein